MYFLLGNRTSIVIINTSRIRKQIIKRKSSQAIIWIFKKFKIDYDVKDICKELV